MTFPIIAPQLGDLADPAWADEITDAVNDHETRLADLDALLSLVTYKDTIETVNNTAVIQNDDELFLSVSASTKYIFDLYVPYNSGTTPDLKVGWTLPASATNVWRVDYFDTAAAAQKGQSSTVPTTGFVIGGFGADLFAYFTGTISVSTTAGTMQVVWAQNTANASNSSILAGAYLRLFPIP